MPPGCTRPLQISTSCWGKRSSWPGKVTAQWYTIVGWTTRGRTQIRPLRLGGQGCEQDSKPSGTDDLVRSSGGGGRGASDSRDAPIRYADYPRPRAPLRVRSSYVEARAGTLASGPTLEWPR